MRQLQIAIIFILLLSGFVGYNTLFSVYQTEQALVLQFGDPKRVIREPGLHAKLPFVQNVIYIDKRILDLDSPAEELIAADQKRLVVDAFTRYRITDPLQFYKALRNIQRAQSRLAAVVSSSMRSVLGEEKFVTVVRDNRANLMARIRTLVNEQSTGFGIEVVDVRIRRADLPEANSQAIYQRMQTERAQEAAEFRAQGQEISRSIRATADKKVTVLLAQAGRDANILRGQGDACRNRIFAAAYGLSPDFFAFYRSMQSYEKALESGQTSFVLSPNSAFFRYISNPNNLLQTIKKEQKNNDRQKNNILRIIQNGESLQGNICPEIAQIAE